MKQRSKEWFKARLGTPTASNFDRVVTAAGSPSEQSKGYMGRLICERIFNRSFEEPVDNKWIRHGLKYEEEAAFKFEAEAGLQTAPVGFVLSECKRWGCSPDRLIVGEKAALEIKCPSPQKHMEYLKFGPGKDYKQQVQGQMLVGGYDMVYFFSYFPGMPNIWIATKRDNKFINNMHEILVEFSKTLDAETRKVEEFYSKWEKVPEYVRALDVIDTLIPEEEYYKNEMGKIDQYSWNPGLGKPRKV